MAELQSYILNNVALTASVSDSEQIARFVGDSIREATAGVPDVSKLGLSYRSGEDEKKITLSYDGRELGGIDASGFVKDGMVSSVSYDEESRELTIKWNADAGRPDEKISLSGLTDTYTAGKGLSLSDGEFSLTADIPSKVSELENDSGYAASAYVDGSCEALSSGLTGWVDGRGYLVPEDVGISYDGGERRIVLSSGGAVTSIDCGDFIKDGMISDVSYDESTHVLSITWNSDGGSKFTSVNLSGLLDVYTAGEGLSLNNGEFSLTAGIPSKVSELSNDSGFVTAGETSRVFIDNRISGIYGQADLSVVRLDSEEYAEMLTAGTVLSNCLYIAESPFNNMYGQQAKNLAAGTDLSDAATFGQVGEAAAAVSAYVDDSCRNLSGGLTGWVDGRGYLTEHQSLTGYYAKSETSSAAEISGALAGKQPSGDYVPESDVYLKGVFDACLSAVRQYGSPEEVPLSAVVDSIWRLSKLRKPITV